MSCFQSFLLFFFGFLASATFLFASIKDVKTALLSQQISYSSSGYGYFYSSNIGENDDEKEGFYNSFLSKTFVKDPVSLKLYCQGHISKTFFSTQNNEVYLNDIVLDSNFISTPNYYSNDASFFYYSIPALSTKHKY